MTDFQNALQPLLADKPSRITLSRPTGREGYIKAVYRPSKYGYRVEKFTKTQVFHENVPTEGLEGHILALFDTVFLGLDGESASETVSMRRSKGGKLLLTRKSKQATKAVAPEPHNREKNYIIRADVSFPVLQELGILTADGKVRSEKYDKFRQINRYIEFIDDIVRNDPRTSWEIIDFGCGKSYLTFVLYHYLRVLRGCQVHIVGLDLKPDVIRTCTDIATRHRLEGLEFRLGDIKDYVSPQKPDMVISLHACDTATDYAIFNAVTWGADYILAVPCCQHELNHAIQAPSLPLMTRSGLIQERFCALATDAIRARTLEAMGYKTDIAEFIDIAHSPKNVLLRGKRISDARAGTRNQALKETKEFCQILGAVPLLPRLFGLLEE